MRKRVSIVIPAYNEEESIEKTILSLLHQTYDNFEMIVIDNNSTDRTREIAEKYVKVVTEKEQGYIHAVIRGIKETSGEIVTVCDADTIYPRNWLKEMMKPFSRNDVVAVYGSAMFKDTNIFMKVFSYLSYSLFLVVSKMLGLDNTAGFNFLFRREAYEKVGGYRKDWRWASPDIELGKRLKMVGKVVLKLRPVYTSSRRFKKGGYLKTATMFCKLWWCMLRNREPALDYKEYNKSRK